MKRLIFTILTTAALSMPAQAKYSGGSGTSGDPYQIATAADLLALAADANDYDANSVLTADIDLDPNLPGGQVFTNAVIYWFTGVFDGNGHTIRILAINSVEYKNWSLGLFGFVFSPGEIKNLRLENINVTSRDNSRELGGLVGTNYAGSISNCCATGNISNGNRSFRTGGLVGVNFSSISDCCSTVDVSGGNNSREIGGLVGSNYGNITNCFSTGTVSSGDNFGSGGMLEGVGGLVGDNFGSISNCYSTGSVGTGWGSVGIGGLVGWNSSDGDINNCYSTGFVSSRDNSFYLGGLLGFNGGNLDNCYSTGGVTGGDNSRELGGMVGGNLDNGSVSNCYSTGSVVAGDNSQELGGLVGVNFEGVGFISNCYFLDTSGPDNGCGEPLRDEQMKQQVSFVGWDFITPVWTINEGVDYPRLWWENTAPVADAGPDQTVYAWIDSIAEVNLDGSGSYDKDDDELTYSWNWTIDGNDYEANGINPTIELPVGQYVVSLIVNDGTVDSEPIEINITVIGPVEVNLCVMPKVLNYKSFMPRIMAMLRLPKDTTRDQIDTNVPLVLYPGQIEADKIWISRGFDFKCRAWNTTILASFDKDQLMDAIDANGVVELAVVGQLKTGQYLFGSDTVRIINPPRRPPWRWCGNNGQKED